MRNWKLLFPALFVVLLHPLSSYGAEQSTYVYKNTSIFKPNDSFDFSTYIREKYKKIRPKLAFRTGEDATKWQNSARVELRNLLKIPASPYCALQPRLGEVVPCQIALGKTVYKYSRQEILFYSRSGFPVIGYLLLPQRKPAKNAAVICLPGHGSRVDDIVGRNPDGTNRVTLSPEYQHDLAVQCVAKGYTVLAIELFGSGIRQFPVSRTTIPQGATCGVMAGYTGAIGENVLGYRVFDVMRAVDYLQARADIDKNKISTMGISAGGALSLFSAAADPRIKAAVVSGFFNDMEFSLFSYLHCGCHYVPNLARALRLADIAGLVAPRLLILEASKQDTGFPLAGAVSAYKEARKIFTALRSPQQIRLFQVEGDHAFDGRSAFASLDAVMKPSRISHATELSNRPR